MRPMVVTIAVIADIARHRRDREKPLEHGGTEEAEEKNLLVILPIWNLP
jgi:hypothetical protein